MPGSGRGADAGFRAHLLRQEAAHGPVPRWLLRSRIENSQMPTKPIVIENSAGEV